MRPLTLVAAAIALSCFSAPVFAAPGRAQAPVAARATKKPLDPQRLAERRVKKLEKLGIDAAKARQAASTMAGFDAERRAAHSAVRKQKQALAELVRAGSDDEAAYSQAIAGLRAAHEQAMSVKKSEGEALARVLDAKDQARLMVAMHGKKHHGERRGGRRGERRGGGRGGQRGPTGGDDGEGF